MAGCFAACRVCSAAVAVATDGRVEGRAASSPSVPASSPPSRSGGHQGDFQFGAALAESALNARDRNSRLGHIGILAVTRLGTLGSRFQATKEAARE